MANMIKSVSPMSMPTLEITGGENPVKISVEGRTYIAVEHNGELRFVNESKRKLWEINKTLEKL